jgi:hypothetical protein
MLANCTTWIARSGYSKTYRLRCTTLVTGGWPTFLPFCALHAEGSRPSVLSLFEDEKGHGRPHIPVVTIQWCFQNMQSFSVAEYLESLKPPSVRSALELSSFGRKELQENNGRRSQQSASRVPRAACAATAAMLKALVGIISIGVPLSALIGMGFFLAALLTIQANANTSQPQPQPGHLSHT